MSVPTITQLSPLFATNNGGVTVTITGTNFNSPNVTSVMFGNLPAVSFIINSGTSISAVLPQFNEQGQSFVVVTNASGSSAMNDFSTFFLVDSSVVPDAEISIPNPFFDALANYVFFGSNYKFLNLAALNGGGSGAAKLPPGSALGAKFLILDPQGNLKLYDGN